MRNIRAAIMPILLLIAICALAWLDVELPIVAHFSFIWDVLLGGALGAGLVFLPTLSGFTVRRNALTGMYWVCGFLSLLLVFYQYMTLVTGLHIDAIAFLDNPGPRMRIIEGTILGYCSFVAGRGKI